MMYYLHRFSDQFIGFNVFFYVTFRGGGNGHGFRDLTL